MLKQRLVVKWKLYKVEKLFIVFYYDVFKVKFDGVQLFFLILIKIKRLFIKEREKKMVKLSDDEMDYIFCLVDEMFIDFVNVFGEIEILKLNLNVEIKNC